MPNSAQRISMGEDLWSVARREKSADYWRAECILARTNAVKAQDQLDEALQVVDAMAEIIEALNLRLMEVGK